MLQFRQASDTEDLTAEEKTLAPSKVSGASKKPAKHSNGCFFNHREVIFNLRTFFSAVSEVIECKNSCFFFEPVSLKNDYTSELY